MYCSRLSIDIDIILKMDINRLTNKFVLSDKWSLGNFKIHLQLSNVVSPGYLLYVAIIRVCMCVCVFSHSKRAAVALFFCRGCMGANAAESIPESKCTEKQMKIFLHIFWACLD